ncbi:hypothetical protein [Ferruginibacter sp. SUN106]|uniref:hypothetical protein n=1 Tax=Ferruginibacter sp. SUN106 TaxID=2978348 RepID=UPI003D3615A4
MKNRILQLVIAYILACIICILYALRYVIESEAFWAHDISITINPIKIITGAVLFLLLPAALLVVLQYLKVMISVKLFRINLVIVMVLMLLIASIINKAAVTNDHFTFISFTKAIAYYLLQAASWIILCMLLIKSITAIARRQTATPS